MASQKDLFQRSPVPYSGDRNIGPVVFFSDLNKVVKRRELILF